MIQDSSLTLITEYPNFPNPTDLPCKDSEVSLIARRTLCGMETTWTYAYPDGRIHTGTIQRGKLHGQVRIVFPNGIEHQGVFEEGQAHGYGESTSPYIGTYRGYFARGNRHGQGTLRLPNGDEYEGMFFENTFRGKGTWRFAHNRGQYTGDLFENRYHGEGKLTFVEGMSYEGEFLNGCFHGKGKIRFPNGIVFTGDFYHGALRDDLAGSFFMESDPDTPLHCIRHKNMVYLGAICDNKFHGQGTLLIAGKKPSFYQGSFFKGKPHGAGVAMTVEDTVIKHYSGGFAHGDFHGEAEFIDGCEWCRGTFVTNHPTEVECRLGLLSLFPSHQIWFKGTRKHSRFYLLPEHTQDALRLPQFTPFLLGEKDHEIPTLPYYPLAFSAHYFPFPPLKAAYELCFLSHPEAAQQITQILQDSGGKALYPYIAKDHAVGIEMERKGEEVLVRVFNSGRGLETYHPRDPHHKQRFETQWTIKVPYQYFSNLQILQLLELQHTRPIYDAYDMLQKLPEASIVPMEPVLTQKEQTGQNCSIEWIFAFLKNTLPAKEYHQCRLNLFRDCLQNAKAATSLNPDLIAKLQRKIQKRERKIRGDYL